MAPKNENAGPEARDALAEIVELHRSRDRLLLMLDAVPAMITLVDAQLRYLYCNRSYAQLLGVDASALLGRTMPEILGPEVFEGLRPHVLQAMDGVEVQYERQHRRADGAPVDLSVTLVPHRDELEVVDGFFALTLDVTRVKSLERKLASMAHHDALTGLANRVLFFERLGAALVRHQRYGDRLAIAYLDVDKFKSTNDTYGHVVGDKLLCEVGRRLRECVRSGDLVARLGGDEFALLLEGSMSLARARGFGEKVLTQMGPALRLGSIELPIRVSIGIALIGNLPISDIELLERADAALYEAKAGGGMRVVVTSC